jgi:hypothetical protein
MSSANFAGVYVINAPDVVAENFDGRIVILNLATGHYFSLEGLGGRIWQLILDGYGFEAISASVASRRPELVESAAAFLRRLIESNLVRPDLQARHVADEIAEAWTGEEPRLIVYDDLAELIYADPIHDVDQQAGWPTRKTE